MRNLDLNDTIAAISTPVGKSGIGIVRLSGRNALKIADKFFMTSNGSYPSKFPSHTIHYGWIVDSSKLKAHSSKEKTSIRDGPERIDEVLLTVMRAPKTYTKEDIVEINCHSGIVVLKRILDLVLKSGARLAEAGEFTKRAYLNGRIDLTQAEAVLDVINSQTQNALSQALGQLQGGLSRKIKGLRKNLLTILTQLQASLDFSDQDIQPESEEKISQRIEKVNRTITELLNTAAKGVILRQGISCVICGKPNVGKSSLLNTLLKKDRAIVTPIPGTTRDSLEETIDLSGIPVRLIDTAGIIHTENLAEKEAVKRSRRHLQEADFVLLVLDKSHRLTSQDLAIAEEIGKNPTFVVLNKQDLPAKINLSQVEKVLPGKKALSISALHGTGIDRLEKEIADYLWQGKARSTEEMLVTNIRHKDALSKAQKSLKRAAKAAKEGQGAEIVALEIRQAEQALGEIIGEISCEDVLKQIFSQFCIGK